MSNRDLAPVFKAIDTMDIARTHADAQRVEMGDEWADELIAWHQANTVAAVDTYLEGHPSPEFAATLRANLLNRAGIVA